MTTVKTEKIVIGGKTTTFETMYAGNQNFVYKINGEVVTPEFFFDEKKFDPAKEIKLDPERDWRFLEINRD